MAQTVQGTFTTGSMASVGNASDSVLVHSNAGTLRLTTLGLDASNTIKTQRRTTPGGAWSDQATYNSDQSATVITVPAGQEWRVVQVTQQAIKDIRYKLSLES